MIFAGNDDTFLWFCTDIEERVGQRCQISYDPNKPIRDQLVAEDANGG